MQKNLTSKGPCSIFYDSTSVGLLKLEVKNAHICALKFVSSKDTPSYPLIKEPSELTSETTLMESPTQGNIPSESSLETKAANQAVALLAFAQIKAYLLGQRKTFDLPIEPSGTSFQKKIWNVIRSIPYGETKSYKEVAILAGQEKAARAVGFAAHRNPILLIIPCHRVIGTNGKLVGYAEGLAKKATFLALEQPQNTTSLFWELDGIKG